MNAVAMEKIIAGKRIEPNSFNLSLKVIITLPFSYQ